MVSQQPTNQRYPDDDAFEMILPLKNASFTLEDQKLNPSTTSQRPFETKSSSSSVANSKLLRWIALAVVMGAVSGFFLGGVVYRNTIKEIRLEFERDLKALRSEIEHELSVHLMATAAVQKATEKSATEFEQHTIQTIGNSRITNVEKGEIHTADKSNRSFYQSLQCRLLPADTDWMNTIQSCLQTITITAMALFDSIRNVIVHLGKKTDDIIAIMMVSIQKTSFGPAVDTVMDSIMKTSYLVTDWFKNTGFHPAIAATIDRIKTICVLPAIDLETLASRDPLQDGVWFSAFLRLLLLFLVSCFVAYYRVSNRRASNKADDSSPPLVRDEQGSKNSQEAGSEEATPGEIERQEDIIMEQMFHDSMAAAVKLPAVTPVLIRPIYSVTHTNTNAAITDPSRPLFALTSQTKISKTEKIRRARINAKAFGARDKLKLSVVPAIAPTKTHHIDNYPAVADKTSDPGTSASSSRRSPIRPPKTGTSPWTTKQERRERARANGKLYGERDQQRIQRAMADSPWKKLGLELQSQS